MMNFNYDILVIGGGHAGCEAANASSTLKANTLLITMNLNHIGQMSCNPAMGGIAKGQIVREIDALGGLSGIVTDKTMIQFRMLNKSKGPAMWSPRAQSDRIKFARTWQGLLQKNKYLDFIQDTVEKLIIKNNTAIGVETKLGFKFFAKSIILTGGTFFNGLIHIGRKKMEGGRIGENKSYGITEQLRSFGFNTGRLKTGTSPRLDGRSIDFSKTQEQKGDSDYSFFSFTSKKKSTFKQKSCFITYSNDLVHQELIKGFSESAILNKQTDSTGPRYCPSIEDKIIRFSDKDRHQLFIEPEGEGTVEMYLNGFSTSLPIVVQIKALKKIKGLENVKILKPGYAIEYDYFNPIQIEHSLETKMIKNLFFAGQINGTTGYEEAACQGLMAGINATLKINNKEPLILSREQAYIGVLIDDLVTKGTTEPYRMFTSRAEHRILLRQDNADERLTEIGFKIGLINKKRMDIFNSKMESKYKLISFINKESLDLDNIKSHISENIKTKTKMSRLLLRNDTCIEKLINLGTLKDFVSINKIDNETLKNVENEIKYKGYISKQKELVKKMMKLEDLKIPKSINYNSINSISFEAREKLEKVKPISIGQASRISGVSPSDINALLIFIGR